MIGILKSPARWLLVPALAGGLLGAQEPGAPRNLRPQQEQTGTRTDAKGELRFALVIGNGGYPDSPLLNPVGDARAVAQALRACGFSVRILENASYRQMWAGVRDFAFDISNGGVGLFYYAGHGMQVKGHNYLMPVDAAVASEEEVPFKSLDVNSVLEKMEMARNRLNVLILDACRNNPFARSWRSGSSGLAQMDAPSGSFIAFATAPGHTAADGAGEHGLFTSYLLTALGREGLKIEDVFKMVRIGVQRESKGQQVPWEGSSLLGDFYFRPHAGDQPEVFDTRLEVDKEDLAYWNTVKDSHEIPRYEDYLRLYPNGYFVSVARLRMESLQPMPGLGEGAGGGAGLTGSLVLTERSRKLCQVVAGDPSEEGARDGLKHRARLHGPGGLEADPDGRVYVADRDNAVIRLVEANGKVSVYAGIPGSRGARDGPAAAATFSAPEGLLILPSGALLVFDPGSATIRKVEKGVVSTFSGKAGSPRHRDGNLASAQFMEPVAGVQDSHGNIYVADRADQTIRRISPKGAVTTFAGYSGKKGAADGFSGDAAFNGPCDLAIDAFDNIFVSDAGNRLIRKIDREDNVQTFAGGGPDTEPRDEFGRQAVFSGPSGICITPQGGIYVLDAPGNRIRYVDPLGKVVTAAQVLSSAAGREGRKPGPGIKLLPGEDVLFSFGNCVALARVKK